MLLVQPEVVAPARQVMGLEMVAVIQMVEIMQVKTRVVAVAVVVLLLELRHQEEMAVKVS